MGKLKKQPDEGKESVRRGDSKRKIQLLIAALLGAFILYRSAVFFSTSSKEPWDLSKNSLVLGEESRDGMVSIPIRTLTVSSRTTVEEMISLRTEAARGLPGLLSNEYEISPLAIMHLRDGAPWWSVPGFFFFGAAPTMAEGPPAEGMGLVNPFLLLYPDFVGLSIRGKLRWDRAKIGSEILHNADFPFRPEPKSLSWNGRKRIAEVDFDLTEYLARLNNYSSQRLSPDDAKFGVVGYNALDMNLMMVALSETESVGIMNPVPLSTPVLAPSLLTWTSPSVCGVPEGCNHRAPLNPALGNIRVTKLPARAVFLLWRDNVDDLELEPDMRFVINIR